MPTTKTKYKRNYNNNWWQKVRRAVWMFVRIGSKTAHRLRCNCKIEKKQKQIWAQANVQENRKKEGMHNKLDKFCVWKEIGVLWNHFCSACISVYLPFWFLPPVAHTHTHTGARSNKISQSQHTRINERDIHEPWWQRDDSTLFAHRIYTNANRVKPEENYRHRWMTHFCVQMPRLKFICICRACQFVCTTRLQCSLMMGNMP